MTLETPKTTVPLSANDLFQFLTDVKNFEKLMPENISKFEVLSDDTFLFALKGMPEIVLKVKEKQAPNKIVLGAATDKLPFTLTSRITETGDSQSETSLVFEGDFNPMMAMMIKGPINSFINTLTEKMSQLG